MAQWKRAWPMLAAAMLLGAPVRADDEPLLEDPVGMLGAEPTPVGGATLTLAGAFQQARTESSEDSVWGSMFDVSWDRIQVHVNAWGGHFVDPKDPAKCLMGRPEALDAHDAVAAAVRTRDPEAAERAMTVITSEIRAALGDLH